MELEGLYNELICLCEVRGELSEDGNAQLESRIAEIRRKIQKLEKANS
jgi:hypothetical protein